MSQCSIAGKEGRANNAGGIARTIGGFKRTYLRRAFVEALDANVTLLQIERNPMVAEVSIGDSVKLQHVQFIKDVYGTK